MCGIFGVTHAKIEHSLAESCLVKITHRGPDGYGIKEIEPKTVFAHRRLAILDLSERGKQPMCYANRYWITFNGEIYNFLELKAELLLKGYDFNSDSDTEIILAAFIEWGSDCLKKFNGMWAFAIYDTYSKRTFIARDRFGKKPLFYTPYQEGIAFASEMKALFPLLDNIVPNYGLVKNSNKIFTYESTEECLIQGIKRFPAGSYAWIDGAQVSITRYWNTLDNLIDVPTEYDKQVQMFQELFFDACKIRMRSDVTLGTALSGGLDSSATISVMANIAGSDSHERVNRDCQHAFVAAFPGTPLDESKYAQMVVDNLGIKSNFIDIDPTKEISKINKYFYMFEDLYITSPIPFMMTYRAIRENGVVVTLDGHGADELFGGYPFDYVNALRDSKFSSVETDNVFAAYYDNYVNQDDSLESDLPSKSALLVQKLLKEPIKDLIKKVIGRRTATFNKDCNHNNFLKLDYLNKILYCSTHETILPTLLRNYDRYSMANGVEIRMPFMDHRIVSFAFSIPWTSKIRNGYSKNIIRDALVPFMPKEIAYRKNKIGFNTPIIEWMQGPMREYFLDTINSGEFINSNIIDAKSVKKQIEDIINDPKAGFGNGEIAWTRFMPYIWEQAVIKQKNIS